MPEPAEIRVDDRDFRHQLLLDLLVALRGVRPGERLAIVGRSPHLAEELRKWATVTGNPIVEERPMPDGSLRITIRKGSASWVSGDSASASERLWLYSNFNCNLSCDYCCVRSSPRAAPRVLDLHTVQRVADESRRHGFRQILVTGGEPFLRPDIAELVGICAAALPTTVLTNATLFAGPRRTQLERLSPERVTLQVSLDSPAPALHDQHRGAGTWESACQGIELARSLGFRIRVAQTTPDAVGRPVMDRWLEDRGVAPEDRVLRPLALRGFATDGIPLTRSDLVPELTITAQGAYWHPVGADDDDFLLTREVVPLQTAVTALGDYRSRELATSETIAQVFRCA